MPGGQQGVGQDPSLQLVGMAFGVFLHIPSSQFLCLCPSCAGEQRCLMPYAQIATGNAGRG